MTKIKNPNYRKFLDQGMIQTIGETEIRQALNNIKGQYTREGRALLIFLYLTGCRPVEATMMKAKDIRKQNRYIICQIPASKRGLSRPVFLPYRMDLVKELYAYSTGLFPDTIMFYHFTNRYERIFKDKHGQIKTRTETTNKIHYFIKKIFKNILEESIPPYFLRHNRFTKLTEAGLSSTDIMQMKGCRTLESVRPYQHLSTKTALKIARKID